LDVFYRRNEELIERLSNFEDAEAFNLHMRRVYLTFNDELSDNLKEFTKFLSRYSIKCGGVLWQKVETMAKGFGKSQITIRRYISVLKKIGIIDRVKPIKGSHYITYFSTDIELLELPEKTVENIARDIADDIPTLIDQENVETTTGATVEGGFSEQEALSFKSLGEPKDLSNKRYAREMPHNTVENTPINTPKTLDHSFIPKWVAADFVEAAKPFFGDAKTITKLWTKATNAARNLDLCGKTEGADSYTDIVIDAFKTTMYNHKRRAIEGSMTGFFYGVVRNKLQDLKDELESVTYNMPKGSVYFDWLSR